MYCIFELLLHAPMSIPFSAILCISLIYFESKIRKIPWRVIFKKPFLDHLNKKNKGEFTVHMILFQSYTVQYNVLYIFEIYDSFCLRPSLIQRSSLVSGARRRPGSSPATRSARSSSSSSSPSCPGSRREPSGRPSP